VITHAAAWPLGSSGHVPEVLQPRVQNPPGAPPESDRFAAEHVVPPAHASPALQGVYGRRPPVVLLTQTPPAPHRLPGARQGAPVAQQAWPICPHALVADTHTPPAPHALPGARQGAPVAQQAWPI
jgi:hypothetical protein